MHESKAPSLVPACVRLASTFAVIASALTVSTAVAATVDLPRFPALSPDGKDLVFSWRGDLWKAPATGGSALRLTTHPADELRPTWSSDGSLLAFESDRDGFRNIFVMKPDGTSIEQVTRLDVPQTLTDFGVGPDGKPTLTFDASLEGDLYRSSRPYQVGLSGGLPRRVHDAFGSFTQYSRDGSKVLFERGASAWFRRNYRGPDARDVWLFDVKDQSFRRLTDWAGNDGMARWIGDDSFVFLSDRQGDTINLFRQSTAPGSTPTQLTDFKDLDIHWVTVSGDGKRAVVAAWDALYAVDLTANKPNATKLAFSASDDGLDDELRKNLGKETTEVAMSPDGLTVALVAYGDVWVKGTADKSVPRRVTDGIGRERDIAWSADGLSLFFVSDREGEESIYSAKVERTRDEVRKRTEERINPPKVEEKTKPETKPETKPDVKPEANPEAPAAAKPATEAFDAGDQSGARRRRGAATEPTPGADDKPADPPKSDDAKPEDKKPKAKKDPAFDPARWADAISFTLTPAVDGPTADTRPSPSPDGNALAFRRGNGDIAVLHFDTKEIKTIVKGFDTDVEFRWSPDSKLIAYTMDDRNFNSDVWIIPADGSEAARNVTRHPDSEKSPRWSADGKVLAFLSERTNEEFDVWCVFLEKDLEGLKGKDLEQYYKDAAEAAKKRKPPEPKGAPKEAAKAVEKDAAKPNDDAKPDVAKVEAKVEAKNETKNETQNETQNETKPQEQNKDAVVATEPAKPDAKPVSPFGELDLDDAYRRVRRVTTLLGNEANLELLPAGDKVLFTGSEGATNSLYTQKTDGTLLAKLGPTGNVQGLNFAGDRVMLVAAGIGQSIGVPGGDVKSYDIAESVEINLAAQSRQKFLEMTRVLGSQFYSNDMKGLDWAKLTERYLSLAERCRTNEEFDWIANRMLGELNASHLGVRSPDVPSPLRQPQGRLGTRVKPVDGGFEITAIIEGTPAALAKQPAKTGDVITAIDFTPLAIGDTVESLLRGKVGKEVVVSVRRPVAGGEPLLLDLLMVPIGIGELATLTYESNTLRNRTLVDEWSGGALGYIHIKGMDQPSLDDFERDLYASAEGKKGLLIDVRNNGGGSTADLLLASIMVKPHAYTIPRGGDPDWHDGYPQDRLFIQRYTLPINMLCNEKSFSNAEIISHAFKTLKRGTLVGQQTYGGVISTGGTALIDGTTVRLPFRGWYLPDGKDMENNGAMPDIVVPQTAEDEAKAFDAQLKAAVDDLMQRMK